MATPTKRAGSSKYKRVATPELGGWNPQEDDTAPERGEFYVVRNLRQVHKGQYEMRSGYKPTLVDASPDATVYSKCEYNVHDTSFDVTMYYDDVSDNVYVVFYNKTTELIAHTQIVLNTSTAPQQVTGIQYQSFFFVSVYEYGNFIIFPEDNTFANWVMVETGKDLACTPNFALNYVRTALNGTPSHDIDPTQSFADTTTGDIIVRTATNDSGEAKFEFLPAQFEPTPIRVTCNAKYWLVSGNTHTKFDPANLKYYDWNVHDYNASALGSSAFGHLRTNGWGYKSVFIYQMTNTEGQVITWRSAPSVDWWVPNMYYVPAFLLTPAVSVPTPKGAKLTTEIQGVSGQNLWRDPLTSMPWFADFPRTADATPSKQDLLDLQGLWRKYHHSDGTNTDDGGTTDPYFFASRWLGWRIGTTSVAKLFPYKVPVSAYELKSAPMSRIRWEDFAQIPTTACNYSPIANPNFVDTDTGFPNVKIIGIEIYRTIFNQFSQDEGKLAAQANLYRYGYVTTLTKGQEFIDSVKDIELDFTKSPDRYTGYLKGQLTGKVVRDYNTKIALGNIESEYYVFAPSPVQHAIVGVGATYNKSDYDQSSPAADGYPPKAFFYQYVDSLGNYSDPQYVPLDFSLCEITSTTTFGIVNFLLPYGYSGSISAVRILHGEYSGSRTYTLVGSTPPKVGYFTIGSLPFGAPVDDTHNTKYSTAEGAISYGEGGSMFAYPFLNFESISQIAPITFMEAILGPLWVWTDRSLDLTTLSTTRPRGEEETKFVGCIGFNAAVKTSKVVFFMSAFGLYFAEASGVVAFPAYIQDIVREYLQEKIEGEPDLLNMSRCSIGWLARREELWVYLPSSKDIGGNLPARLLVIRFFDGNVSDWMNYEFDLTNWLDQDLYPEILRPVVMRGHTDGTMFSSHIQSQNSQLMILDNDRSEEEYKWMGVTYLEKRYPMGLSGVRKILREIIWRVSGKTKMSITTGLVTVQSSIPVPDGTPDYKGQIYSASRTFLVKFLSESFETMRHIVNGHAAETTSYTPVVRIVTEPDEDGNNSLSYYSIETLLELDGDHP